MQLQNSKIKSKFNAYPDSVKPQMLALRALVFEVANEQREVGRVEETLKWGEPSFKSKHGSTLRMDWKEKSPDQYAMYFTCTTKLVPTFRILYKDVLNFEGNRAIVFKIDEELPVDIVKNCISAVLNYQKVKDLPLLGL